MSQSAHRTEGSETLAPGEPGERGGLVGRAHLVHDVGVGLERDPSFPHLLGARRKNTRRRTEPGEYRDEKDGIATGEADERRVGRLVRFVFAAVCSALGVLSTHGGSGGVLCTRLSQSANLVFSFLY